jgi:transposase
VIIRLASDPDTKAYTERRLKEGRSRREVIRVLKRYIAREVYRHCLACSSVGFANVACVVELH